MTRDTRAYLRASRGPGSGGPAGPPSSGRSKYSENRAVSRMLAFVTRLQRRGNRARTRC